MIKIPSYLYKSTGALTATVLLPAIAFGQSGDTADDGEDIFVLSPFEVSGDATSGYSTQATLAGNRLKTDLKDLGTSLSVYNDQFLDDVGATDSSSLLKYTLGTEVGGVNGNYSGSGGGTDPNSNSSLSPQSTNRVRGLVGADNTRDLYLSGIPWDGYNVDGVDIQRGPNAILFGQGSPGGVINARIKQAKWDDSNEVSLRLDQYGSIRATVDLNRVIIEDELAVRFSAVDSRSEFKQKQAFDDVQRQFITFRYEPKFLASENARSIFKASYENGDGESNRPRNMPPRDRITPWFTELNKNLYDVAWGNDANFQIPGRGAAARQDFATPANPNPNYVERIGNSTNGTGYAGYFGGSIFYYLPGESEPTFGLTPNAVTYLGRGADGERDGNIGGLADGNPHGMGGYRDYAQYKGLPFASLTKDKFLTDPTVFDFYNNLLDGNIKREWQNFDSMDVSFSQTFFGDTMGFDIGYHKESYLSGGYNPVSDTIQIDVNSRFADGTNTPQTGWYTDGTVNPGAGRAYVRLGNGKGESVTDRDSYRATAFFSHDFDKGDNNWITRLLGKHTITGMASKDDYLSEGQNWRGSTFVGDYYELGQFDEIKENNGRFWADFVPMQNVYISSNLQGATLGQDLGIRSPMVAPQFAETMTLRYFDSTWNKPTDPNAAGYVDPAAEWLNQVTAGTEGGPFVSTQSENPANYVGWGTREVQLMTDADPSNRDFLTESRSWDDRYNDAYAFVWQGKLWDGSLVATAGIRNDEVGQVRTTWNQDSSVYDEVPYVVNETGPFEEESKSWGLVAHLNDLPFVGKFVDNLPVNVSVSYNKSNNFQTGQVFVDYWGQPLPLPEGNTEDMGVMVATKDGKYSVKLNKFESDVKNNVGTGLQFWNYGNNLGIYASAYHQIKYNYETRGNPNSTSYGDGIISDLPVPVENEPRTKYNFDYLPIDGQTQAEAEALEIAVINAYDQWLEEMSPLPQLMGEAWSFAWDGSDFTEQGIPFRFTDDIKAEGYELELYAQVTDNWRLTMNASRIKSYRDNLGQTLAPGGEMTMIEYLLDFNDRMNTTAMGDLRIWGPGGGANARDNWNGYADGDIKARLAEEGTVVPENRLWHVNFVTNYDFNDGRFKGFSLGGSARYQSAATLAYKPYYETSEFTGREFLAYDLDTPFRDDSQLDFDLWVGYSRKLSGDKVDWRIQMNVSNVGIGNELVPVTVQPDGSVAAWRIRPPQQIFVTNTFKF